MTPTVNDGGALVRVNGVGTASGSASGPIALTAGENIVHIVVTAKDGTAQKTYTLAVTKKVAGIKVPAGIDADKQVTV